MEEIVFDGKKYISSKLAAKLTGYAKDYVGQLCREGRVTARLVGRSWYVLEDSIKEHRFGVENSSSKKTINILNKKKTSVKKEKPDAYIKYIPEEVIPIPIIEHPNLFRNTHKTFKIENENGINLNKKETKQDLLEEQNTCISGKNTNKTCESNYDKTLDNIAISRIEKHSKQQSIHRNALIDSFETNKSNINSSIEKNNLIEFVGTNKYKNETFIRNVNLLFITVAIIISIIGIFSMGVIHLSVFPTSWSQYMSGTMLYIAK